MNIRKEIKIAIQNKKYKRIDFLVTLSLIVLLIFSCIMVYSASMIGNKYGMFTGGVQVSSNYFFKKQILWAILSLLSYLFFSVIFPYRIFKEKKFYEIFAIFLAILLLLPFLQSSVNGAHSWIRIGGFTFQPSTAAQIFVIAYMALMFESRRKILIRPTSLKNILHIFAIPLFIIFLIFIQNDSGTMLITTTVVFVILLCSNMCFSNILKILKISSISFLVLMFFLLLSSLFSGKSSYRVNRFKTFINPFSGNTISDNHIVNSLISFSNGGVFGRGLGNSIQKLGYLPEAHTDFILAVTAEELGYIGVLFLILLLLIVVLKVIYTGLKSHGTFESLFSLGFASLLLIQIIINIGGVSASLPMTGVPIPFFSFGGSSMFILATTLGVIMNIHSIIKLENNR
ncbi:FtsW/RodA/SpoVE family cell cycle protein [Gemelliphila asaccharolytica]|uniref:Probable peptidoglycan glycosyltransferase FtsW n=1 Tax=Gemelliphila asaccharolytica TaxID=502393 RepID=A0ABR5TMT3_9BACL|nr:FtsW/RodA/SpoVE family cell cycle protein [Gemella asaccharolytica]KXB58649.1 cell cycle protein, FtsW/RodA/SpoVE family [Gemella asaccharolytica]